MIALSVLLNAKFIRDIDGVVTDSRTALQWQDDYSDNNNSIKNATWMDAIDYCETLNLGEKSDWRLPNKNELLSIVDYNRYKPSIDNVFKNTTLDNYYWSSTSNQFLHYGAWIVYFGNGYTDRDSKSNSCYVRCVREGKY